MNKPQLASEAKALPWAAVAARLEAMPFPQTLRLRDEL